MRAIIRDGTAAFVGSQSLRKLELDGRREVGVIVSDAADRQEDASVFEATGEDDVEVGSEVAVENGKLEKAVRKEAAVDKA